MAYFAKVSKNTVVKVIVADSSFFDTFVDSSPGTWLETSDAIRKNYAGIGYTYDAGRDAFIPPQPFPSWTLDEGTCRWVPPTAQPAGDYTFWNEGTQSWDTP